MSFDPTTLTNAGHGALWQEVVNHTRTLATAYDAQNVPAFLSAQLSRDMAADDLAEATGHDPDEILDAADAIVENERNAAIAEEVFAGDQNEVLDEGITLGDAKALFLKGYSVG